MNPHLCWVDLWALGRIFGRLERALQDPARTSPTEVRDLIRKAMALYQGNFLAREAAVPWSISCREHQLHRFKHFLERVGRYWEERGDHQEAIACYQKGLATDELAEAFYQRLMICHRQLGRRAEAVLIYRRCKEVLSSVLGIDPSPETEAIFKSLSR